MFRILPMQCKMARAATGWGVRDLARQAKISPDTVARFERGELLRNKTIQAIRNAFEAVGVEFIPNGVIVHARDTNIDILFQGDGPPVRTEQ
jgi:transcriptional regulator with XRE-family HTH domain